MVRSRSAPGGGTVVEIEPARLAGWVNRFAGRNDGLRAMDVDEQSVLLRGGDGTTATIAVPFPPFALGHREPVEAVLDHVANIGATAVLLVRAGAYSIGVVRDGTVLSSTTDRQYVQGRTAAGGWSQQRYARRRGNQLRASQQSAAGAAARILTPIMGTLQAVVVGGDASSLASVLDDPRLAALNTLPRRTFGDVAEPRRAVLDEIAARVLTLEITVRSP